MLYHLAHLYCSISLHFLYLIFASHHHLQLDEPSAYLDSEQRIVSSKVIKRFIMHAKKFEHDFIMATYLADRSVQGGMLNRISMIGSLSMIMVIAVTILKLCYPYTCG